MPCYTPLTSYKGTEFHASGKRKRVFSKAIALTGIPELIACGQCSGCRLERSRQWAIRCMHEASLHEDNCFITLTYDDEHVPAYGSINKKDFQKFIRALRKKFRDQKIRYYECGEYGEKFGRPHYHACLFGFEFPDRKLWKAGETKKTEKVFINGVQTTRQLAMPEKLTDDLYTSEILNEIWGKGYTQIGAVNFKSAAYCARYIMKKINGPQKEEKDPDSGLSHYERLDEFTGEIVELEPEYTTMSLKPGIGGDWYKKYKNDLFPDDFCVVNGKKVKGPKYYDSLYEIERPEEMQRIKAKRVASARERWRDNTPKRLAVRKVCAESRAERSVRTL